MYISIDVGATNIGIAGSDSLKKPKLDFFAKIDIQDDYSKDLENITGEFKHISNLQGVTLGVPGILNEAKTQARTLNLKSWFGKNLKEDLESRLGCKVILENDAALAALGEGMYGNGKNKDFIFMIWGTGVGGTRIQHESGSIKYFPLEPGHDIIIKEGGREGSCGHRGDLESYTGGASVKKYYGKTADKLSDEEWDEVVSYFAKGIGMILETYPLDLIVFGGGVATRQPDKIERIQKEVQREFPSVGLTTSALGENAALYGGFGLLALQEN